jgi:vacuolar protein sorting-associated protein 26
MPVSRMEISLIRRESLGTPDNTTSHSKTLEKFEVMDGCPDEGDTVPFRMCMRGVKNLTPSYKAIHNRLFVRHWFMVTIYDEMGHKFFKQAEITFYRKRI